MFVVTVSWCGHICESLHTDLAVMKSRGNVAQKAVIPFFWVLTMLLLVVLGRVAFLFLCEVRDAIRLL
jgi:hypothetical protein